MLISLFVVWKLSSSIPNTTSSECLRLRLRPPKGTRSSLDWSMPQVAWDHTGKLWSSSGIRASPKLQDSSSPSVKRLSWNSQQLWVKIWRNTEEEWPTSIKHSKFSRTYSWLYLKSPRSQSSSYQTDRTLSTVRTNSETRWNHWGEAKEGILPFSVWVFRVVFLQRYQWISGNCTIQEMRKFLPYTWLSMPVRRHFSINLKQCRTASGHQVMSDALMPRAHSKSTLGSKKLFLSLKKENGLWCIRKSNNWS